MRDLQSVARECMKELDKIGIKYGNVVKFEVNTRAKSRWGQCKNLGNNNFSINISIYLLDDTTDIKGLKNTILHELLHTCKGCQNHGTEWKRLAAIVNRAYGYNIKRTSSADDKGCTCKPDKSDTPKKIKHVLQCKHCGQKIIRYRDSKFTNNPDYYRCGVCGGKFEKIF